MPSSVTLAFLRPARSTWNLVSSPSRPSTTLSVDLAAEGLLKEEADGVGRVIGIATEQPASSDKADRTPRTRDGWPILPPDLFQLFLNGMVPFRCGRGLTSIPG